MSIWLLVPLLAFAIIGVLSVACMAGLVVLAVSSARQDDGTIEARQDAMKERELQEMIERHQQETQ